MLTTALAVAIGIILAPFLAYAIACIFVIIAVFVRG